jgi:hypothetical protein
VTGAAGTTGATGPAGTPGAAGATGPTGTEAELKWEAPQSISTGLENFGGEYAPLQWALGGNGEVYLSGVLKVNVDQAENSTLFVLPEAARPTFKKLIWIGNAQSQRGEGGALMAVEKDGAVKTVGPLTAAGWVPAFDGVQFSKLH